MDTSNPVIPNDRRSIADLLEMSKKRRRQDLRYLGEVTRTAPREFLPVEHPRLPSEEVQQIVAHYRDTMPKVDDTKEYPIPDTLQEQSPGFHISGVLGADGLPLHHPSVNCSKGLVSVKRKMGGVGGVPFGMADLTEILGDAVLGVNYVYTNGTWEGFMKRIKKQTGRKTESVISCYRAFYNNPKMSEDAVLDILDELMPRGPSDSRWPKLSADLDEMLAQIKVTGNASAGMPYHANKSEVMDDILTVTIPMLVKAIKENKLKEFWMENPEFFLCELKNKRDRYEIDKLAEKCRPYLSIPAHIALLQSILCQRFQETLTVFTENFKSSNAYGMTAAKGGLKKFFHWMRTATERGRIVAYGDDVRIAIKRNGVVFIVDPDFQQMDGSIDADDVKLVISWIRRHFKREEGEIPPFWNVICNLWSLYASNPSFLIDGTTVYTKKTSSGLFSGVPGTTLFDTVKSVMMWNLYLDMCQREGFDPLDYDTAHKFMSASGLVIKEGTWNPAELPNPTHGQLLTDHKFLGVQIRTDEYDGRYVFIPTVPEEDAINMLLCQKDDPFDKDKSPLSKARTLYDRMRGLYMTIGFSNPLLQSAIHNVVNNLNPVAIVMAVMSGTGDAPESLILDKFTYPDSSGFPTADFCYKLFSDKEYEQKESWLQIFPTLDPLLKDFKKQDRYVGVVRKTQKVDAYTDAPASEFTAPHNLVESVTYSYKDVSKEDLIKEIKELFMHSELKILDLIDSKFKDQKIPDVSKQKPHEKSKYINAEGEEPIKRAPPVGVHMRQFLKDNGVVTVKEMRDKFELSIESLRRNCQQYAIFLTGVERDDLVSLVPVATPIPTEQAEIADKIYEKRNVIGQGVEVRQHASKMINSPGEFPSKLVKTGPFKPFIDHAFFRATAPPPDISDPVLALNVFTTNYIQLDPRVFTAKFVNHTTDPKADPPNGVDLVVRLLDQETNTPTDVWEKVASARALNCKLAKQAIVAEVYRFKGKPFQPDKFTTLRHVTPKKEVTTHLRESYPEHPVEGPLQESTGAVHKSQYWQDSLDPDAKRVDPERVKKNLFHEQAPVLRNYVRGAAAAQVQRSHNVATHSHLFEQLSKFLGQPQEGLAGSSVADYNFPERIAGLIDRFANNNEHAERLLVNMAGFITHEYRHRQGPLPEKDRISEIYHLIQTFGPSYVASNTKFPSKRMKLSQQRKAVLNRKTLERRKTKKLNQASSAN